MITFTLCLLALIAGYFTYGRLMERVFGPDDRKTPALTKADGVDYIPLPTWKIFMIQFLNIAGLGPIFGAIMGAKFGTSSYLWIVLGSIFAGAVHDYFAGMLSLRHGGESLPEIIGRYLGLTTKQIMRGFTVLLMILVGSVFVAGPAGLLAKLTPESLDATFWIVVVFLYYILATLLPVDKIIGKIYPLFAVALLFMAVGILVMLYVNHPALPELWDGLQNTNPDASELPIFPIMFVSIACGAISGFHATQSPLMARCMTSERHGRPVFYGAMITEGIVALIWAAAATYFFHENGMGENNAAVVVDAITKAVKTDHKAISAAVFPGPSMARKMVRQDWGEWTLDAYYPMIYNKFYYEGPEWIGRSVKESVETVNGRAKIYAGLMFGDIKDNFEEALDEAYNNGASGVSFFDGPDEEYLHKFKAYLDKRGFVVK